MKTGSLQILRTISVLLLCTTGGVVTAPGQVLPRQQEPITEIPLGDGIKAEIRQPEFTGPLLYLPGRKSPVSLPEGGYVRTAAVSPDRKSMLLMVRVSDSNAAVCLFCRRSDVTASAAWTVQFLLSEQELDGRAWIEDLHHLYNEGRVIWKVVQMSSRFPPSVAMRTWEEWDLVRQERVKVIKDARSFEPF